MPILTTKELQALSDQLDFEKVLHCKYLSAVQECQDDGLKGKLQSMADQHRQNYTTLLGYLKRRRNSSRRGMLTHSEAKVS